ncbi:hypothetical protein LV779_30930 [Streptomyces thinghirensis]|nr:hypothetical protein [Streptomyces thinghirensis]
MGDVRLTHVVDAAMELDRTGFLPAVPAAYWEGTPRGADTLGAGSGLGGVVCSSSGGTVGC